MITFPLFLCASPLLPRLYLYLFFFFFSFYYLDCFAYAYFPRNPQCREKREREGETQRTFFFFVWRSSIWLTWRVVCPRKKEKKKRKKTPLTFLGWDYGSHREEEMNFVPGIWGEDPPPLLFYPFFSCNFHFSYSRPSNSYFITPKQRKKVLENKPRVFGFLCTSTPPKQYSQCVCVLVCVLYLRRHIDLDLISLTWSARERKREIDTNAPVSPAVLYGRSPMGGNYRSRARKGNRWALILCWDRLVFSSSSPSIKLLPLWIEHYA